MGIVISSNGKLSAIFSLFFFGLFLYAMSSCNFGPPDDSRPAQAARGKAHFDKYCSSCHGENGKGLQIDSLEIQPADLTRIMASRRTGEFPILEIARIIDGRKMIPVHGERAMPVWGDVFAQEEYLDESQIKGKLAEIIAYLMSIQGK